MAALHLRSVVPAQQPRNEGDGTSSLDIVPSRGLGAPRSKLQDYILQVTYWRQQEGIARTIASNERELFQRYQEIMEITLDNINEALANERIGTENLQTRLREELRLFKRDKDSLAEQSKILRFAETRLGDIHYQMSEIDEAFSAEFGFALPFAMSDGDCSESASSHNLSDAPQLIYQYLDKSQEINVIEDRIAELEQADILAHDLGREVASQDQFRLQALKARLESSRGEGDQLKQSCLAQGSDPEAFRWRRSSDNSTCSAPDVDLELYDVVTMDEIQP